MYFIFKADPKVEGLSWHCLALSSKEVDKNRTLTKESANSIDFYYFCHVENRIVLPKRTSTIPLRRKGLDQMGKRRNISNAGDWHF